MPPKASKNTAAAAANDAASGGTTLSPKETQILLAVVSCMPEVPDVSHGLILLSILIKLECKSNSNTGKFW
jgi:hypothetical protein